METKDNITDFEKCTRDDDISFLTEASAVWPLNEVENIDTDLKTPIQLKTSYEISPYPEGIYCLLASPTASVATERTRHIVAKTATKEICLRDRKSGRSSSNPVMTQNKASAT